MSAMLEQLRRLWSMYSANQDGDMYAGMEALLTDLITISTEAGLDGYIVQECMDAAVEK